MCFPFRVERDDNHPAFGENRPPVAAAIMTICVLVALAMLLGALGYGLWSVL